MVFGSTLGLAIGYAGALTALTVSFALARAASASPRARHLLGTAIGIAVPAVVWNLLGAVIAP